MNVRSEQRSARCEDESGEHEGAPRRVLGHAVLGNDRPKQLTTPHGRFVVNDPSFHFG